MKGAFVYATSDSQHDSQLSDQMTDFQHRVVFEFDIDAPLPWTASKTLNLVVRTLSGILVFD